MQRVDPPHDRKLSRRRRPRFVIEAAAAQPQQFRLPRQRQVMASVDHRLALSRPALLSAPDKKSFSKVSSPILAWRVFRSTDGVASVTAPPEPNSPEAASTRCPFQAVIWFGCTSYCCANSASVFSPLMAASATFALKAGAWVRRDRFVMVVPDPRHPRRSQAEIPLIGLSGFGRPPLTLAEFTKTTLIGGILIILPIYVSILLLAKAIGGLMALVAPIAAGIPASAGIREVLSVIALAVVCFITGLIVRTGPGLRAKNAFEGAVISKLPGYTLLRGLTGRLAGQVDEPTFAPALVEIEEALVPALIIEELEDGSYTVLVPSVPTPMAGALYILPRERVHPV